MPKCPECGAEIDYLNNYQTGQTKYNFMLDEHGHPIHVDGYSLNWILEEEYECPECDIALFDNDESAGKFLMGEEVIK